MRGFLQQVHFASSELHYKAEVFRPDPSGDEFFVRPVSEDGKFIDLVWATIDLDAWGFSTGRGAVLGSENLSKIYTAELPLHVYDDPILYWEHLGDEELAGQDAICLLKPTARALIPAVGHVQVFYWDGVEGLAEGFFPDHPERVSAWQDREAFNSFVNRAALWERFDHMESPILPETSRLTWAHAKAAIKSRRKVNNQTELDQFEEYRAGVRTRASDPEARAAVSAWCSDPSEASRALAQKACMPFFLSDVMMGGASPQSDAGHEVQGPDLDGFERAEWRWKGPMIKSGSGWTEREPDDGPWNLQHRWQRDLARKKAAEAKPGRESSSGMTTRNGEKSHPLDGVTLGRGGSTGGIQGA